jgi:preprotein translocase subunit SecA
MEPEKKEKKLTKKVEEIEILKLEAFKKQDRKAMIKKVDGKWAYNVPEVHPMYAYITFRSMTGKEKFI